MRELLGEIFREAHAMYVPEGRETDLADFAQVRVGKVNIFPYPYTSAILCGNQILRRVAGRPRHRREMTL